MKKLLIFLLVLPFHFLLKAQTENCTFKPPFYTIHFGTGNVSDINTVVPSHYERVFNPCPSDGHYAFVSSTSDCFSGDWFDLSEDHTSGDRNGNMMLVNASYPTGEFLITTINGFKGSTTYQFAVWMMNLCRISDKCPFPLLPRINIQLQSPEGKMIAQFTTGEIQRQTSPNWKQYRAIFTTPPSTTTLKLIMIDLSPGGCGNDFALDDITFQECIKPTPVVKEKPKPPPTEKRQPLTKTSVKKEAAPSAKNPKKQIIPEKPVSTTPRLDQAVSKPTVTVFPPPPSILTTRDNPLIKQIKTEAGELRIDLYDNGEIDGDTITVYHNNQLVVAHAALSAKPITFHIKVDASDPHHELIMVADNLGSIPPNTSLMIITAGDKRYEAFISSTEQKNAKVVIDLKE